VEAGTHSPEPLHDRVRAAHVLDAFAARGEMYAARVRENRTVAGFTGFVPRSMDWRER
jgi:hypothetical protein